MSVILGLAVGGSFCWPESLRERQSSPLSFLFCKCEARCGALLPSRGVPFAYPAGKKHPKAK